MTPLRPLNSNDDKRCVNHQLKSAYERFDPRLEPDEDLIRQLRDVYVKRGPVNEPRVRLLRCAAPA